MHPSIVLCSSEYLYHTVLKFVIYIEFEEIFNTTADRDKHLWKMADQNNDGHLDEKEFLPFQHPEHSKVTVRHAVMRFKSLR